MKIYMVAFMACFSCVVLADDAQLDNDASPQKNILSVVAATPFEYSMDKGLGDEVKFAVRLKDASGTIVRNLQSAQLTLTVDEGVVRTASDGIKIVRGAVFDSAESISVFLVNGSGAMRLLNSEKVNRFFAEISVSVNETSGLVLYGNAQNGIDSDWVLTPVIGSKAVASLRQSVEGGVIPDPVLAIQDVFRKLAEQPQDGVQSIFMLTDGSGFESRSPASVAGELNEVFGKQQGKDSIDFYLIDFSDRPELSQKLQDFVSEIKALENGIELQIFKASNSAALLGAIQKDRQLDYKITLRGDDILPRDGFVHSVQVEFDLGEGEVILAGSVKTAKGGIAYRNFMLAGIGVGLFAIIALSILMVIARKP